MRLKRHWRDVLFVSVPVIYQDSLTSESSNTSSHTSSGLFDDDQDNMAELHGNTFKERVDHLLTVNEKSHLRTILTTYNREKYALSFLFFPIKFLKDISPFCGPLIPLF